MKAAPAWMPARGLDDRDERRALYYRQGYWRDPDLWSSVSAIAQIDPHKVALIEGERTLTFSQWQAQAERVAGGLAALGTSPGDVVLILGRNSLASSVALLACACVGAVMAPIPPMFSSTQIAAICVSAQPAVMIALGEDKEVQRAVEGVATAGTATRLVTPTGAAPAASAWAMLANGPGGALDRDSQAEQLALLVYSSGTTGSPKGVMHSANTLRFAIEQRAAAQQVSADDVCLVAAQFGFVGSVVFGILAGALLGTTSVLMPSWNGEEALRLIARHRISYGLLMPTHVHDVLHAPALASIDVSSFVRCAMSGLSAARREEVRLRLCPQPFAAYGMSECLGLASSRPGDSLYEQLNTDGAPLPGNEVRIVDAQGTPCAVGEVGEILVRGPCCFLGYYANLELSAQCLDARGWLRTGDLGKLDGNGRLVYVAREKDVIRRGGVNIYPGDTEIVLAAHPRIEHVALVAYPDERLGERACACVITRDRRAIDLESLCAWLQSHGVARYAWPERVECFDCFPRSASLKVQKGVLVEHVRTRQS